MNHQCTTEKFLLDTWSISFRLSRQAFLRPISSVSFIPSIHSIVSTAVRENSQYIFGTLTPLARSYCTVFPAVVFWWLFWLSPVHPSKLCLNKLCMNLIKDNIKFNHTHTHWALWKGVDILKRHLIHKKMPSPTLHPERISIKRTKK